MAIDEQGRDFVKLVQQYTEKLSDVITTLDDLESMYWKRGYDSGAKEITDADLSQRCITKADLTAWVTLAQQLRNFRDNQAVTQGDYRATIQKVRWMQ